MFIMSNYFKQWRLGVFLKDYPIICVLLLFVIIASIISRCNIIDAFKFVVVQFAFLFTPGYAIQRMIGLRYNDKIVRAMMSYATGYSLSILVYLFLLMGSGHQVVLYIYLLLFLVSIVYLCFINKKDYDDCLQDGKEHQYLSLILLFALCITCIVFQCSNLSPLLKEGNSFVYQDYVFWMRNSVAATKSYPLPDLSVLGRELHYHYFTSVEMAFLRYTTGIEMLDLCFAYSYIVTMFLIISGIYVLAKYLFIDPRMIIIASCFIMFTANFDIITWVNFPGLMYNPFGYGEGIAFFCFSLYLYIRIIEEKDNQWKTLPLLLVFIFVLTGLKGTVALVLLCGFGIGSVILMSKKGRLVYGVVSGTLLLSSFLIPLFMFVMGEAVETGSGRSVGFSISDTVFFSGYFYKFFLLIESCLWKPIAYGVTFIAYLFLSFIIPILLYLVLHVKRNVRSREWILLLLLFCGVLLGLFASQGGMSQVHFMGVAILCLYIYLFKDINFDVIKNIKNKKILIGVLFLGLSLFCIYHLWRIRQGVKKTILANSYNVNKISGLTLSKVELEGLRWCRDNLPDNAVLLSNKVLCNEGERSFWVSSISERQTFEESYSYSNVNMVKAAQDVEKIRRFYETGSDLLWFKQHKVTHAVVFKNVIPNKFPPQSKIVFENKELLVVEL